MRFFAIFLAILSVVGCTTEKPPQAAKPPPITEVDQERSAAFKNPSETRTAKGQRDGGGLVRRYVENAQFAAQHNMRVEIRAGDECNSSCILKLGSGANLCVDPKATFGVHQPRASAGAKAGSYSGPLAQKAMENVRDTLPSCAFSLFERKGGFDSGKITVFSGREVLEACPQIKPCP